MEQANIGRPVMIQADGLGNPVPIPAEFDAQWLIERIHQLGIEEGYQRTRIDRGTHPRNDRYYEVGYGPMYTVTMQTSLGEVYRITAETWASLSLLSIRQMLINNREQTA